MGDEKIVAGAGGRPPENPETVHPAIFPVADSVIRIVNARQNNLQGVTVDLPHRALIVVTGPSGSGKSTLAFDTLYAEGQRRYIESLSTYAKQFLERMPKPLVDRLEGIAPSVAIEQRNPVVSSRSTVGTATEVYDYLRLLWARIGRSFCRACGAPVRVDTPQSAADDVVAGRAAAPGADRLSPAAGGPADPRRGGGEPARARLRPGDGRRRAASPRRAAAPGSTSPGRASCWWWWTGSAARAESARPDSEAVAVAFQEGEGVALALHDGGRLRFTRTPCVQRLRHAGRHRDPGPLLLQQSRAAPAPPATASAPCWSTTSRWSSPTRRGAWPTARSIPGPSPATRPAAGCCSSSRGASAPIPTKPWHKLKAAHRRELLYGRKGRYVGIFPFLKGLEEKRYKQYIRVFLRQYQLAKTCADCGGARLNADALAVRIAGETIADVAGPAGGRHPSVARRRSALTPFEREVRAPDRRAARRAPRASCGTWASATSTLDRQTRTLSGGEAQRISLSNALGAQLVDTLYVLDEPSIGLHPRDTDRLLALLRRLRDGGNTVIVVEHDLAAIRQADFMLELGPGAGDRGGRVVHAGPVAAATADPHRPVPHRRRSGSPCPACAGRPGPRWLKVRGATLHNLRGVDVDIPLGTLTAVTGVSGSGKSTLLYDVIYRNLEARLHGGHSAKSHLGEAGRPGRLDHRLGAAPGRAADRPVADRPLARAPIRSPTSRRSTRSGSSSPPSRCRASGSTRPATFSFNMPGGRCEECEGAGHVQVEMVFLADVFVPCEACGGSRYRREVLDVRIQGHSIHDVLQWTVDEAIARFRHQPKLGAALWQLQQVGLGYLRLGQPATTLSGGEAQRLKIARELIQAGKRDGRKLYILDEPTTGLHLDDVRVLIQVLDRLVDAGHTVVGHRASPRRHQAGRLDRGPRTRGRRRRGPGGGARRPRRHRWKRGVPHRALPPPAAPLTRSRARRLALPGLSRLPGLP